MVLGSNRRKWNVVAVNRQARFRYEIIDKYEASIVLKGSEVKALRNGYAAITESYAAVCGRDVVLFNAHIPEYVQANRFNHDTRRPRRLLLHRREIDKLLGATERRGMTLIPLDIHFNDRGYAKLSLAVGRGKKLHDKREAVKKRDWEIEKNRMLKKGYRAG